MNTDATKALRSDYAIPELTPELERGPLWLRHLRKQSREAFNDSDIPQRGLHLWRYTDPMTFMTRHESTDTAYGDNYDVVEQTLKAQLVDGTLAGLVTDLGGRDIRVFGTEKTDAQGLVVMRLSEAVEKHHDLVERHLYSLVNHETGKFESLNGALWNDGVFVHVADGRTLAQPLHLLREAGLAGSAQYPRLLVVVGRNAELTLIDEYGGGPVDGDASPAYANAAVEIVAGDDSRVRYVSLQRYASGVNSYLTHRARIGRGASMLTVPLAFGGAVSKRNYGVILDGPNAESRMVGLVFGSQWQHIDNHTLHHHAAGSTMSNIDFKVVLRDKALSAYTGLIRIEKHAKTCEAYQENRNLLLSRGTKAETIPELEILNEDVRCTHGATIGPIDPEAIFYLKSRGISQADATRIIVRGFVEGTLKQLPGDLRERIAAFVAQRLEHL